MGCTKGTKPHGAAALGCPGPALAACRWAREWSSTRRWPPPPCGALPARLPAACTEAPPPLPQATFLRSGGDASAAVNTALEAELEALGDEELELRCRRAGVSRKGGRSAQVSRLLALDAYLHGDSAKGGGAGGSDAPAREAAQPTAAWAEVGAEAQGPKSKWELQDEQEPADAAPAAAAEAQPPTATPRSKWDAADEGQQQQQPVAAAHEPHSGGRQPSSRWTAASAAAAAAAAESDSDDDLAATVAAAKRQAAAAAPPAAATPTAAGAGQRGAPPAAQAEAPPPAPAGLDPALEEERRQRLRQVEVVLVQFRERLEDKGLSRELVDKKVAEQRAKLLADAEAALAAKAAGAAAGPSRAGSAGGGSTSRGGERERDQRERGSREPSSRSERRRSRSRDRDLRRRSRSRSRSRERRRRHSRSPRRSRRSSRSRSRSRERRR